MDAYDLLYALRNKLGNKIDFAGVFSSDHVREFHLPLRRDKTIAFIANILREGDTRLGHWVAFAITKPPQNRIYFYDSYGLNPVLYTPDFKVFLKRNSDFEIYSFNRRLQSPKSSVCGLYCAHFIYLISKYEINKAVNILRRVFPTERGRKNDQRVYEFYINYLNTRPCLHWKNKTRAMITYEECKKNLLR